MVVQNPLSGCLINFSNLRPWGTPYNGLHEAAPPERGTYIRPQVNKRVGVSLHCHYGL